MAFSTPNATATAYLHRPYNGSLPSGGAVALSCWVRNLSSVDCNVLYLNNTTGTKYYMGLATSAGVFYCVYANASLTRNEHISVSTNSSWSHYLSVFSDQGVPTGYLNGVLFGNDQGPGGNFGVGQIWDELLVSQSASAAHTVAEVALWRGRLFGQTEAKLLAAGENPLSVQLGSLIDYFPLRNSYANFGPSKLGLTPMGGVTPVWTDHPPTKPIPRIQRPWIKALVGAAVIRRPLIRIMA